MQSSRHDKNPNKTLDKTSDETFDKKPQDIAFRRALCPPIHYPAQIPVSARRTEIAEAIANHQVVIVSGETGSGKTTQLPKICLELGRGIAGLIGHTQPRRLAARTVAERLAKELNTPLGDVVGYQVRFTDKVSENTLVKLMTDGILLAEIQNDPLLKRYDTIIVDEAHERSLNIDFILGYLANLLPKRPDIKVIITSATIDAARFAKHFASHLAPTPTAKTPQTPVPIIEVSGRTYPVEIRYRPLVPDLPEHLNDPHTQTKRQTPGSTLVDDAQAIDQTTGIVRACREIMREGPGDILVFLSGEGEIRDTAQALQDEFRAQYVPLDAPASAQIPNSISVVPLYSRLSAAEQHRIFEPHRSRRIVLATNVAETSITVPGIRFVVDAGTARISRYSTRTKVQRLPIEPISQASANQRSGRCGRVADGIAIRIYSAADFARRPEFTEPEILRTSLASVIIQMAAAGLGDVENFPFVDPPDSKAIRDGRLQLEELGAVKTGKNSRLQLTGIGRRLARLPIDPRLGRMLLEAQRNGCVDEVLVIVAALSVQDVRERPTDKQTQADQFHARFTDPVSDFLAYLNIWRYLHEVQSCSSNSALRRTMRAEFLNYLRWREWQDVVSQLKSAMRLSRSRDNRKLSDPGLASLAGFSGFTGFAGLTGLADSADLADAIHRSLLVGLLPNIGCFDLQRGDYQGTRGTHFTIWPGSGLYKKRTPWVVAAELVETSRIYARTVAAIKPEWVEALAGTAIRRSYSEPVWSSRQGAAFVREKLMLYGLTLIADRQVLAAKTGDLGASMAREMFIRHALVDMDWRMSSSIDFCKENARRLEEAQDLCKRRREFALVADEEARFEFFDALIPQSIVSGNHFWQWWKRQKQRTPDLLTYPRSFLVPPELSQSDFPDVWRQGGLELALSYEYMPGEDHDGVTVEIPVLALAQLKEDGFDWLVPGLRKDLVTSTLKALPKAVRRTLAPLEQTASQVFACLPTDSPGYSYPVAESFREAFSRAVWETKKVEIPQDSWDDLVLPSYLRMRFKVVDANGAVLAEDDSFANCRQRLTSQTQTAVAEAVRDAVKQAARSRRKRPGNCLTDGDLPVEVDYLDANNLADLPKEVCTVKDGMTVRAYPAWVEEVAADGSAKVALRLLTSAAHQSVAHVGGVQHLVWERAKLPTQRIVTRWKGREALILGASPYASTQAIADDCQRAAVNYLLEQWSAPTGEKTVAATLPDVPKPAKPSFARPQKTITSLADLQGLRDQMLSVTSTASATATSTASPQGSSSVSSAPANDPVPSALLSIRSQASLEEAVLWVRHRLEDETYRIARIVASVLETHTRVVKQIEYCRHSRNADLAAVVEDVSEQSRRLIGDGFVSHTPFSWLSEFPRYFAAMLTRIERAEQAPGRDVFIMQQVHDVQSQVDEYYRGVCRMLQSPNFSPAALDRARKARWLCEEIRVSLFAQQLGTPVKVSPQRILRLLGR